MEVTSGGEVNEDDGRQGVVLTVGLDGSPYAVVTTVDLSIGGTAGAGTDFESAFITSEMVSGSGNRELVDDRVTLDIPAGVREIEVTLDLVPLADDIDERNETIVIVGAVGDLTPGQATIEILDAIDDVAGIVLSTTTLRVAEGETVVYFVSLATEPLGNVQVSLSVRVTLATVILSFWSPAVLTIYSRRTGMRRGCGLWTVSADDG